MRNVFALVAAVVLLGASPPKDEATYFTGAWTCGPIPWTFEALSPHSHWTRITYGSNPQVPFGTAVLGYVDGMNGYVYRDFHTDGAYADLTSPGPKDDRWIWTGTYYAGLGQAPIQVRITYVITGAKRFERLFGTLEKDGTLSSKGSDVCIKT